MTIQALRWILLSAIASSSFVYAQTEPLGGQPAPGAAQSVHDLEAQVAYQRAFEATLWAVPASAIYRFRVGMLEVPGMADNVITAFSVSGNHAAFFRIA